MNLLTYVCWKESSLLGPFFMVPNSQLHTVGCRVDRLGTHFVFGLYSQISVAQHWQTKCSKGIFKLALSVDVRLHPPR